MMVEAMGSRAARFGSYEWHPTFSGARLSRAPGNESGHAIMPRIPSRDLNCAFYLYPDESSARAGRKVGGSGFWVAVSSTRVAEFWWLYAVSNRHLVHRHGASVIRANSKSGNGVKIIPAEPTDWIDHPAGHDLAILPIDGHGNPPDIDAATVVPGMFITQQDIESGAVGIGDEVYLIGRFINHEGTARNTPSARFGNISMLPGEPIYVDSTFPPQESFAVELRSMCGYSGSPVFVTGVEIHRRFARSIRGPDALLGVHWGHIVDHWTVETKIVRRAMPTALGPDEQEIDQVSANTGMNGVVPAWRLMELLDMPRFKNVRIAEEDAEIARLSRDSPGAVLDGAVDVVSASVTADANPQHQEDFTSLLSAAARKRPQGDKT
jgi:hypothetical protein